MDKKILFLGAIAFSTYIFIQYVELKEINIAA